jgi:hypothetical protein
MDLGTTSEDLRTGFEVLDEALRIEVQLELDLYRQVDEMVLLGVVVVECEGR